jgi:hypothetical protein
METKGSLQCAQMPISGTYPEPGKSSQNTHPTSLRYILILPSHLSFSSSKSLLPFRLSDDSPVYTSHHCHLP